MIFNRPIWAPNVILVDLSSSELAEGLDKLVRHIGLKNQLVGINALSDELEIASRKIIIHQEDYEIFRELPSESINPSTIMLQEEVKIAYYVDASEESYKAAFSHIYDLIGDEYPILCLCNDLTKKLEASVILCSNPDAYSHLNLKNTKFLTLSQFLNSSVKYLDKAFVISK